jgi:DNA modification methylase
MYSIKEFVPMENEGEKLGAGSAIEGYRINSFNPSVTPSSVPSSTPLSGTDIQTQEMQLFTHSITNKIVLMDCLDGMKLLLDDSIDIVITSPPYNLTTRIGEGDIYDVYSDDLTETQYYEWLCTIMDELLRITKYYIFFNIQMLSTNKVAFLKLLSKYQSNIKEIVIWAKPNCPPASSERVLSNSYEFILCISKYDRLNKQFVRAFFNNRTKGHENISNCIIRPMQFENECAEHKATFPEWLPEFFIKHFSKEGDLILDPFMGTGTTAAVAKRLNRNYCGFDISENYIKFANNRLSQIHLRGLQYSNNSSPFVHKPSQKKLEI